MVVADTAREECCNLCSLTALSIKYFTFLLTEDQKPPVTLRQVEIPNNCISAELLQAVRSELSITGNNIVLKVYGLTFYLNYNVYSGIP